VTSANVKGGWISGDYLDSERTIKIAIQFVLLLREVEQLRQ